MKEYVILNYTPIFSLVDFCGQTIKGDGMVVNSNKDSKKYYFVTTGTK